MFNGNIIVKDTIIVATIIITPICRSYASIKANPNKRGARIRAKINVILTVAIMSGLSFPLMRQNHDADPEDIDKKLVKIDKI